MTEIDMGSHGHESEPAVTSEEVIISLAPEESETGQVQEAPEAPSDHLPLVDAQSGSSPPDRINEDIFHLDDSSGESLSPPSPGRLSLPEEEDDEMMGTECETGLLDDLEDEDEVITFAAPAPPIMAKPIVIAQGDAPVSPEKTGMGRLRTLSMNGHLTLNLQPQPMPLSTSPSRDGSSSSPTMGRFKVTTCQSETTNNTNTGPSRNGPGPSVPPPPPMGPEPDGAMPAIPQPKDERQMTPLERLQLYIDHPNMVCRSGVAVQYVNFIKDAEDPEAFITASARMFDRLIQDQENSVRTAFLENLPNIVRAYKPSFKRLRMMAFLGDSIRDDNYNVRRLAQVAIGQLIDFAPELMTRDTIQASVVPLLIQIFYGESSADLTIDALNLFCKLLDKVGPDPVRRLFIPEFTKLCNHDIAQIRQVCAQNLVFVVRFFAITHAEEFQEDDEFCRAVQDRIIQLGQDFAWHVRETVASILPQVIDICHKRWPNFAARQLNNAYAALLNDQAKQVRRWATRGLGRIIATNADPAKTRLHLTNSGTVEFVPPTSYRFSDSDLMDVVETRRMSPSISEGVLSGEQRNRVNGRGLLQGRSAGGALSSPALSHGNADHPRRNYYNRLGIVTSLNHALSEAEAKEKPAERPDFNCFRFWQNPIPQVAVCDKEGTPVIIPVPVKAETASSSSASANADVEQDKIESILKTSMEELEEEQPATEKEEKIPDSSSPESSTPNDEIPPSQVETETDGNSLSELGSQPMEVEETLVSQEKTTEETVVEISPAQTASQEGSTESPIDSSSSPLTKKTEKSSPEEFVSSLYSDDTRSVSSASSTSQDLTATFTVSSTSQVPYSQSYEIDPFIIEKHKRRDRAIMQQLKESGEIVTRMEDILPYVQFLREFLALAKDPDRDTVVQVAVDFPAVALTMGRQFWPELQESHKILATHNVVQARELMAASLPRIAEMVGYYYTVVDLVPLVSEFLKDTDSVRLHMIENYSAFIMRMPPEIRPLHLLRLCEFFTPDEERNWRYRYACAEQIAHLALLFPPKLVVRNLMDGAWFFARDRTAEVRKHSTVALSSIFQRIEQQRDQASRTLFLAKLDLFLRNEDYRSRQVFAQFCEDLLSKAALSFESFSLYFGERFWPLFDTPVVTVRLAAARCLVYIPASGRKQSLFGKAMDKLQHDDSRTIQEMYTSIMASANIPSATGN